MARDPLRIITGDDQVVEDADWVEMHSLLRDDGSTSIEDLSRAIYQATAASETGCRERAEEAYRELADRTTSTGNSHQSSVAGYPFQLTDGGRVLRRGARRRNRNAGLVYLFLLAVSRGDMRSRSRVLSGLDPTVIFERLCANILIGFWGGPSQHTDGLIIGTAQPGGRRSFGADIGRLCGELREGIGWRKEARSPRGGDAGLDLAVWHRFSDGRQGALVGFSQCKTGLHWRDHLTRLKPQAFSQKYMRRPLILEPLSIYMVPHRINGQRWEDDSSDAGLLFDRCRITEYGSCVTRANLGDCRTWYETFMGESRQMINSLRQPS